jgi:RimJ/RimL family protein N-acetyltransferase
MQHSKFSIEIFNQNANMLTINFNPFPNLETERLLLRRVDSNDIKEIFAYDPSETMKYIPRPLVKPMKKL